MQKKITLNQNGSPRKIWTRKITPLKTALALAEPQRQKALGLPRKPPSASKAAVKIVKPKPADYVFGRPSKYLPEYCQDLLDYCNAEKLPWLKTWGHRIGVSVDTLSEWCKVHPDFSAAYKQGQAIQEYKIYAGASTGKLNPNISIFGLKNLHGWKDTPAIDQRSIQVFQVVRQLPQGVQVDTQIGYSDLDKLIETASQQKTMGLESPVDDQNFSGNTLPLPIAGSETARQSGPFTKHPPEGLS